MLTTSCCQLMEEHTLKTFEGLNIVLAGFQEGTSLLCASGAARR